MTLIIAPTYRRYEPYCDALVRLMDEMWPGHPDIWFLTDGNGIAHKNRIQIPQASWTEIFHQGLVQIRAKFPEVRHVYVILEDLFPLTPCDSARLVRECKAAEDADLDLLFYFPPGAKPVMDGQATIGGVELQVMASDFRYASSLQPAIWKLDYLIEVAAYALQQGIHDPWRFEFINLGRTHYKSIYPWPTAFCGIFKEGQVNPEAIRLLRSENFAGFRRKLLAEYLISWPRHFTRRTSGRISRRLARTFKAIATS